MKYKLILAYDGTRYAGWQQQKELPSIEQVLKSSFTKVFGRTIVQMVAASRTDAGVHALGQVVLCSFEIELPPERIKKIWNDALPADVVIRSLVIAPTDFHPWYNVAHKEYCYYITTEKPLPFLAPYVWYSRGPLDFAKMKEALTLFVGTHDFTPFASADDERTDLVRTVDAVTISYLKKWRVWQITVIGKKFVRHMVRRMVGAAVYIAADKKRNCAILQQTLASGLRAHEYPTAPAQGLVLRSIKYL